MRIAFLAALAGLTVSSVATAQDKPAAPVSAAKKDDGDKRVCRALPNSGSRLGGQVECHAKREWEAMRNAAQTDVRDLPGATAR